MSNGMRSCAQGVRGVVIALYRLVLFCHIKLGLLNKRVSMQPPAPKHKAWGKRQDLTMAAGCCDPVCLRPDPGCLLAVLFIVFSFFAAAPAHAVKCIQAGYPPSEGAVDCKASIIIDDYYIGIVGISSSNWLVGPTSDVAQAEADGIAFAERRYACYVGSEVIQEWTPLSWGDSGYDANGRQRSFRVWYKGYRSTYQQANGPAGTCTNVTYTWDWGLRRDQWATCPGKYYDWFYAAEGGDNSIVCWDTKPVEENCNDTVGNPVSTASGAKIQREAHITAGVLQLSWHYKSSRNLIEGNMPAAPASSVATMAFNDHVWRHDFDKNLKFSVNGSRAVVRLVRPDTIRDTYFFKIDGQWKRATSEHDELTEFPESSSSRWVYRNNDDSTETYSATGKLLTIANRTGRTQTLAYDLPAASGGDDDPETLDNVTDDIGRQLRFTYDANKRIATVTDPAGGVITYGYDAQSNLVSVQYPDGRSKTYHYNEPENTSGANLPHALTGITDENGDRYATYQYSADGKAISTGHANGADLHTLAYNPDGSTTVTDPLGTQRTHNFTTILGVVKSTGQSQPGGSGCGPASSATTYDANGNIASRADFNGNKTCYAYDLTRNLETARVEGLASGTACPATLATYTPAANSAQRKILTEWHPSFRLPVKVTEAGRETSAVYDTRGNITSHSIKDTALNQTRTSTTTYTYHATVPGILVQKIDNGPRTDVADITTTDYYLPDENCLGGHMGCRGQVRQVTNALGHVTTYNEYDPNGRVLRTTDPNGLVTTMVYTLRGWLTSRDVGGELTRFDYDNVGQLIKLTRPDGSHVGFEYDAAHRLTAIVQQDGARLTYTLDPAGNRIQEDITGADGSYVYYTHRRTFDALGRLWQDIGAYNQTVTYEYDAQGNLKQIDGARTDVADLTRHTYDNLDRLTQTLNADSGIEQTTVNALDQTTRVVDPANQATQHTVNALGDILQTVSADTGTTMRTFDEAGNLKTVRDARGVTVTYTYDSLNRLTGKTNSQGDSAVYAYQYDTCRKGSLCTTLRNGYLEIQHSYDTRGRLQWRMQNTFGAHEVFTMQSYDAAGRLSQIDYPRSRFVTYRYDQQGRISQVSASSYTTGALATPLASEFVYGYPFAGPQSFRFGNGQTFNLGRDQDYRLATLADGPYQKTYSHDPAGNVASLTDIGNTVLSYSYDSSGRLTGATDTAAGSFGLLGYSYDPNGNRQSETRNAGIVPYVYSPPNWLYQKGSDTRSKTASGNTASSTALGSFSYDGYNRLATSQTAAETTTYTYNALGERYQKINQNGLSTVFHYGPDGELLYEQDANGNTRVYVWLDGRPLARIDNNAQIYYYHVDHLGTPQAMTDNTGTTVWKADYEPFGKATVRINTVENNLRFPGQYFDRETGLHYNYFRDYDPGTGRYVEADPIGIAGGLNVYEYARSNPLTYTDPLGLEATLGDIFGAGARGAARGGAKGGRGGLPGVIAGAVIGAGAAIYEACKDDSCPPCKTMSGKIVPVGTIAYRPLDTPSKPEHGIVGPHYNVYKANQIPAPNCDCFWQSIGAVPPSALPAGAIPIEPFTR